MSQSGSWFVNSGPGAVVETLAGNTGGPVGPFLGNINVIGTGNITVTGNPESSTLTISEIASEATTFDGDIGSAVASGGVLTIESGVSTINSGSSVLFSGSGSTLTLDVSDAHNNTIIGEAAGNGSISGTGNVGLGVAALSDLTSGLNNVAIGSGALTDVTGGAAGAGGTNVAVGESALGSLITGKANVAIGTLAGKNYTTTESNNISIGSLVEGTTGESAVMRLGGSGVSTAFLGGIYDVNIGSTANVATVAPTGQFGTAVITSGNNITVTPAANTITVNVSGTTNHAVQLGNSTGSLTSVAVGTTGQVLTGVTGGSPTFQSPASSSITLTGDSGGALTGSSFTIYADHAAQNCGESVTISGSGTTLKLNVTDANNNTLIGFESGNTNTTGTDNTALGGAALQSLTIGISNTAIGYNALNNITTTDYNTALGALALYNVTSGASNTGIGAGSLGSSGTGSNNTCLGYSSGSAYTTSESSNICIGSTTSGTITESNVLRIGAATGSGAGQLSSAYICGIDGVNVGSVATVVTEASNKLGTAVITAGTNITITPTANTITITASGSPVVFVTKITNSSSPYTVLSTDYFIAANSTAGAITVKLPNAPTEGQIYIIKDSFGTAASNNITVTTVGGTETIDGVTSFVMNTNYESVSLLFDGINWEIF